MLGLSAPAIAALLAAREGGDGTAAAGATATSAPSGVSSPTSAGTSSVASPSGAPDASAPASGGMPPSIPQFQAPTILNPRPSTGCKDDDARWTRSRRSNSSSP